MSHTSRRLRLAKRGLPPHGFLHVTTTDQRLTPQDAEALRRQFLDAARTGLVVTSPNIRVERYR